MSAPSAHLQAPKAVISHIVGHPFDAPIVLIELCDRGEPQSTWQGRAVRLSRSHLVLCSRKLSYEGRVILAAVHMIDASPTCLAGKVMVCDYLGGTKFAIALALIETPQSPSIDAWLAAIDRRPTRATLAAP